jgi:AcrR family transcriptional regulator
MTASPHLVQPPQQARSRETMTQILDAAARILESKTFEELTLAEVVQRAGTSVGAFYGRFKDKEGLLHALDERFFEEFERGVQDLLSRPGWRQAPLGQIIRDLTGFLAQTYERQKGLLRSLNLKARLYGDSRFKERERRAWDELFPQFQDILLRRADEIRHPNPALAVTLGFQQLFFALREILLWEPLRGGQTYEMDVLVDELSRAYLAYLGIQEEA